MNTNPLFQTLYQASNGKGKQKKGLMEVIKDETLSTKDQCNFIHETMKGLGKDIGQYKRSIANASEINSDIILHEREKRGIIFPILTLGFNAIDFITSTIGITNKLSSWREEHKPMDGFENDVQILNELIDEHKIMIEEAMTYTDLKTEEIRIQRKVEKVCNHIEDVTSSLETILFDKSYIPSAHSYLTGKTFNSIQRKIRKEHDLDPPDNINLIETTINLEKNMYLIEFNIPLNYKTYKSSLFRIHSLGIFNSKNLRYMPKIQDKYIAVNLMGDQIFTTLDEAEFKNCLTRTICTARNPGTIAKDSCAVCNYRNSQDRNCCEYVKAEYPEEPNFITLEETTYFAAKNNEKIEAKITCSTEARSGFERDETKMLENSGKFTLGTGCQATIGSKIIRPTAAPRSTAKGRFEEKPKISEKFKITFQEPHIPKLTEFTLDMKTLKPTEIFDKYVIPTALVVVALMLVAVLTVLLYMNYVKDRTKEEIMNITTRLDTTVHPEQIKNTKAHPKQFKIQFFGRNKPQKNSVEVEDETSHWDIIQNMTMARINQVEQRLSNMVDQQMENVMTKIPEIMKRYISYDTCGPYHEYEHNRQRNTIGKFNRIDNAEIEADMMDMQAKRGKLGLASTLV